MIGYDTYSKVSYSAYPWKPGNQKEPVIELITLFSGTLRKSILPQ